MEMIVTLEWIISLAIGTFISTYIIDRKVMNKGICPECGKLLRYRGKDGFFHIYSCLGTEPFHTHVVVIGNPYVKWKYNRKIRNRKEK